MVARGRQKVVREGLSDTAINDANYEEVTGLGRGFQEEGRGV